MPRTAGRGSDLSQPCPDAQSFLSVGFLDDGKGGCMPRREPGGYSGVEDDDLRSCGRRYEYPALHPRIPASPAFGGFPLYGVAPCDCGGRAESRVGGLSSGIVLAGSATSFAEVSFRPNVVFADMVLAWGIIVGNFVSHSVETNRCRRKSVPLSIYRRKGDVVTRSVGIIPSPTESISGCRHTRNGRPFR